MKKNILIRDLLTSQEYWNKKPKISQPSNFIGNQLKKLLNTNNKKIDELDVDNLICTYCRKYNDDGKGPINWLYCDKCHNWMHNNCALKADIEISDIFLCNECLINENATIVDLIKTIDQKKRRGGRP